jgi:hypothetical protein
MKINQKIFNSVTSEPFDVQELKDGVVIELHSLNQNEVLFNEYAPKAKFAIWTSVDGKNYRILLEDTYYPRMRELYGKRVNQCMIDFWNNVEVERGKIMKFIFLPISILVFVIFILLMIFGEQLGQAQMVIMTITLIGFIVANVFVNKKVEKVLNKHNSEAVEKIKNIIGHKRFDELMDEQQAHYDDFFGINKEEVTEENNSSEEQGE